MRPLGLVNLDVGVLCARAGGDPWQLDDELQAGDAGAIDDLADAFHRSGNHVKEADDDFDQAKQKFQDAYTRNHSEHPINDSDEVQRVTEGLGVHKEALPRIAADLEKVAAALAVAQRDSDAKIVELNSLLQDIDDQMSDAQANDANTGPLEFKAALATKAALDGIEKIRGAYVAEMHSAEASMMAAGYSPDAIDDVDGVPGDAPGEAARQYDESGQRARDQALVDRAKAEGRSDALAGVGLPGHFTQEEADAAARLRDYKTVTAPPLSDADRRNPTQLRENAQARRWAGERLDDYNVVHSTGPVAKDNVLGGDARTRAQARLNLQRDLENGNLSWHQQPMTPDEATQLVNNMEAHDRATVIGRTVDELVDGGMTRKGAADFVDAIAHGTLPDEYVRGVDLAGTGLGATDKGLGKFGDSIADHGRHWSTEAAAANADDVEALKKLGKTLGRGGSVLAVGSAAYEVFGEHKPLGEVGAKAAAGWAGMAAGAKGGALAGELVAGPPGAFVGALVFGGLGGWGGTWLADHGYDWLMK